MVWGAAIGALGSIAGGLLASSGQKSAQSANNAATERLNRNRVQWTVEDAKKAGIHPLAALGASSLGGFASPSFIQPSPMGSAIGSAFQSVGDGVADFQQSRRDEDKAFRDRMERGNARRSEIELREIDQAERKRQFDEQARTRKLQNDLLEEQIRAARQRTAIEAMRAAATGGPVVGGVLTGPNGGQFTTSPSSTQQQVEDEYGGIVGEAYGVYRGVNDWYNHNRKEQ